MSRLIACRVSLVLVGVLFLRLAPSAAVPAFMPDDPIGREPDPYDASRVKPFPIHLAWDLVSGLFGKPGDPATGRATNVNTIGEVPDSSWFTNRAGTAGLTPADVGAGPDTTAGPAAGPWTVVSGKSEGVRPGFTIVDATGVRWFLKFDARGHPEQATGAEVVSTKLFWALGYNVAETHVATLRRENLVLSENATTTINGKRRRLTAADLHRVLAQAEPNSDGSYRVLASKALDGTPVGGFLYYGTRADDPNDVIQHENRRELRGMGVFAAWIDRVDAKAGNTLDTLVHENGKVVVRHHVLDFGSTLGSAGTEPNEYWEGFQYIYEGPTLLKRLVTFGLPVTSWRTIHYPALRGVGRIESEHFDLDMWKSRVPNAAYRRADADDEFWAARKVMAISDEMIAAAVQSGKYSDPAAERYLIQTLIARRNAIGRTCFDQINTVVDPTLDSTGALKFANAAVEADLFSAPDRYQAVWYLFDNATGETTGILGRTESRAPVMRAPAPLPQSAGAFVCVDISAVSAEHVPWRVPVRAYFRRTSNGWGLVGLERVGDGDQHMKSN